MAVHFVVEFVRMIIPLQDALTGEDVVDHPGNDNTDAGIQHSVQRVRDVGVHRSVEQDDAENDTARLDPAGPFEEAAGDDQQDNADKGTEVHQGVHSAFRMEDDVDAEHSHTDEAADDGSKQSVSAGEPGVTHIVPHTEDRTDAGKGGIAVEGGVKQRTKSGCNGGLDVSHPDFVEGMLR